MITVQSLLSLNFIFKVRMRRIRYNRQDCVYETRFYVDIKCQLDAKDDFYCRSYCLLNMFRAPLCPSSGVREYYTSGAACRIWCFGFQVVGMVWSWRLCVQFAGCCSSSPQISHTTLDLKLHETNNCFYLWISEIGKLSCLIQKLPKLLIFWVHSRLTLKSRVADLFTLHIFYFCFC